MQENNVNELGALTICALRYCFGRVSYMPSLVVDATKSNWHLLSQNDINTIEKDLLEALSNRYSGMDCDAKMWNSFLQWISEKKEEQEKANKVTEEQLINNRRILY
jgi:hypothetical protein